MYALISPNEPRETGYRIAQVSETIFEIAPPLFWTECADNIIANEYWYDPTDQQIKLIPPPQPQPDENQSTTNGTQTL